MSSEDCCSTGCLCLTYDMRNLAVSVFGSINGSVPGAIFFGSVQDESGEYTIIFTLSLQLTSPNTYYTVERVVIVKNGSVCRTATFYTTTDNQGYTNLGRYCDCTTSSALIVDETPYRQIRFSY